MSKEEMLTKFQEAVQNKLVQIAGGLVVTLVLGFISGRGSVDVPEKEIMCLEYIRDNKTLTQQLTTCRESCFKEKVELTQKVKDEMQDLCNKRVDDAYKEAEFSPKFHCPICKARGLCK